MPDARHPGLDIRVWIILSLRQGTGPYGHFDCPFDQTWQFVLEVNGEWRDKTEVDGASDKNTGGNVVFGTAGVRWGYGDWSTHLAFAAPIYEDFNGTQSEPEWRLSTGISMAF